MPGVLEVVALTLSISVYSWLLSMLRLNFKLSFAAGIALSLLSSALYAGRSFLAVSSILLATILALAVLSGFLLVFDNLIEESNSRRALIVIPASTVAIIFSLGYGTALSYSFIYPALSSLNYTGVLYTAFGMLGIFLQAFIESLAVSLVIRTANPKS